MSTVLKKVSGCVANHVSPIAKMDVLSSWYGLPLVVGNSLGAVASLATHQGGDKRLPIDASNYSFLTLSSCLFTGWQGVVDLAIAVNDFFEAKSRLDRPAMALAGMEGGRAATQIGSGVANVLELISSLSSLMLTHFREGERKLEGLFNKISYGAGVSSNLLLAVSYLFQGVISVFFEYKAARFSSKFYQAKSKVNFLEKRIRVCNDEVEYKLRREALGVLISKKKGKKRAAAQKKAQSIDQQLKRFFFEAKGSYKQRVHLALQKRKELEYAYFPQLYSTIGDEVIKGKMEGKIRAVKACLKSKKERKLGQVLPSHRVNKLKINESVDEKTVEKVKKAALRNRYMNWIMIGACVLGLSAVALSFIFPPSSLIGILLMASMWSASNILMIAGDSYLLYQAISHADKGAWDHKVLWISGAVSILAFAATVVLTITLSLAFPPLIFAALFTAVSLLCLVGVAVFSEKARKRRAKKGKLSEALPKDSSKRQVCSTGSSMDSYRRCKILKQTVETDILAKCASIKKIKKNGKVVYIRNPEVSEENFNKAVQYLKDIEELFESLKEESSQLEEIFDKKLEEEHLQAYVHKAKEKELETGSVFRDKSAWISRRSSMRSTQESLPGDSKTLKKRAPLDEQDRSIVTKRDFFSSTQTFFEEESLARSLKDLF